jgi:hypothetical protein
VAPLLRVDIGGVDELPLWRNIINLMIKRIEPMKKMNNEQQKTVGPLRWQPISDRMRTQRYMNATLKNQATAMAIRGTGKKC